MSDQLRRLQMQALSQQDQTTVKQERRHTDIKQAETRIHLELNADKQHRKENEVKTGKIIDEKLYNLRLELTREKKAREECNERHSNTFGAQISRIETVI